ncbi:GMC oxidoreductase [Intrasporangium calvum]|uniref:Cholesterol oxidase n=1 Tax=Intrasporangium calvum (strain ATCC 23552 / DSM 43043 / JCM 3097 / NBRC 12989 / NCIMB 10167 / NRRL B-3866 / 7 KIP) TaxID=710696 RepID=E6SDC4_INTC7|nr:GMC family oxidoreductase [Intrasporangium calvum]ADU47546.1 FAD-dependent pyridine nucleotide-disulfide oxidoreductase [Intrasporangium calvum DSM 43043]
MTQAYDHDIVVIGSGFGGSVAALRLAEKGYRVHVYEAGRRFADEDFAETSWNLRRYLWAPRLGCYGVQRIHRLPHCLVLAGAGVGGGSLNYANTLYIPPEPFFRDPQWAGITDWQGELAPHYATAQRMLGVVENPCEGRVEQLMRDTANDLGVGRTFRKTPVGVFFGEPGKRVPDPYFGGQGPDRAGCTECGNCMVGCKVGAKNTLVKNYLALAERRGVTIEPLRTVTALRPLDPARPETGYAVTTVRSGAWTSRGKAARTVTAAQVVIAAGAWGTAELLQTMKTTDLPRLSPRLGELTRTNSEALGGAMTTRVPDGIDLTKGVAITSSFHINDTTHVENVRYGKGSNAMGFLAIMQVDGGGRLPRWLRFLGLAVQRPHVFLRSLSKRRWSERSVIALVMQTTDNSIRVSRKRGLLGAHLTSSDGHGTPSPTYIPEGNAAVRAMARRLQQVTGIRAEAGSSIGEIVDIPLTAHFIGGAVISDTPAGGVVDPYHRVWSYPGLHVVDGAAISANLGVNPSLTITAMAERALSLWPAKGQPDPRPEQGRAYERLVAEPPVPAGT